MHAHRSLDTNPGPEQLDYEALVERHHESLYRFAFGLTGNESDASDLTQDTYRTLLVKGGQIREHAKVRSWLFSTLYRNFLSRRRHVTKFPQVAVDAAEWELPSVDSRPDETLDAGTVVAALQRLDEKHRAPLVLFYLEDRSYKEIAETVGVPIGTVMSRLSRGKDILRRWLEGPNPIPSSSARGLETNHQRSSLPAPPSIFASAVLCA